VTASDFKSDLAGILSERKPPRKQQRADCRLFSIAHAAHECSEADRMPLSAGDAARETSRSLVLSAWAILSEVCLSNVPGN